MLERITEDAEVIKALRCCVTDCNNIQSRLCNKCNYAKYADGKHGCENKLKADAADAIEELIPRLPKWIDANERLPEKSGEHIVFLEGARVWREQDNDVSYVTSMWFDKKQNIWKEMNGDDSYNAVLSAVDTEWSCSVTHWMELPKPPVNKESEDAV